MKITKTKAKQIVNILSKEFLDKPALNFSTPFELLVAVVLSAQCTDQRVNLVTKELFKNYNTPEKMLMLNQAELEKYIYSCGLSVKIRKESFEIVKRLVLMAGLPSFAGFFSVKEFGDKRFVRSI